METHITASPPNDMDWWVYCVCICPSKEDYYHHFVGITKWRCRVGLFKAIWAYSGLGSFFLFYEDTQHTHTHDCTHTQSTDTCSLLLVVLKGFLSSLWFSAHGRHVNSKAALLLPLLSLYFLLCILLSFFIWFPHSSFTLCFYSLIFYFAMLTAAFLLGPILKKIPKLNEQHQIYDMQ